MAYAKIYFRNPHTEKTREAPVGFSWTVAFFGPFVPLYRADWRGFLIILLVGIATAGLSNFVFMFIYNKMYIKHLISDAYKATHASVHLDFIEEKIGSQIPRLAPPA